MADAHRTLSLSFAFRLWDGALVPAGSDPNGLIIAIKDPGVLADLIRKLSLESVLKTHVAGLLEPENGTFFDLAKARPAGKVGKLLKKLDKGALICHAAEHYGVVATGVTLAAEQRAEVERRIEERGLQGRVSVLFQDYVTIEGENRFDKISSIGMFEQVGLKNHETYFKTVHRLLKPRGLYLHHSIARPAKPGGLSKAKPEYKALVKYIFPGGELDHVGLSVSNLEAARFEVHDVEAWREHYQRTTKLWHDRLWARRAEAEAEVGPETTRTWLLYLAGCSLAFERGAVGIFQTLASKRAKGASGLASTRAELYR